MPKTGLSEKAAFFYSTCLSISPPCTVSLRNRIAGNSLLQRRFDKRRIKKVMKMKNSKKNRSFFRFGALLVLVALWVIVPFVIGDRTASAEEMVSDIVVAATLTGAPINGVTPSGF